MADIDDGGSAFPMPYSTDEHMHPANCTVAEYGMSLRDWFAAHDEGFHPETDPSFAANFAADPWPEDGTTLEKIKWWAKANANFRYMRADAMLAARKDPS